MEPINLEETCSHQQKMATPCERLVRYSRLELIYV